MSDTMQHPVRLLVVDDEPDLETLIRQKFRKKIQAGAYAITFAGNGRQALDVLDEDQGIDVILTDINMPVMDGLSFLKALREDHRDRQPAVVMCTTENEMARIVEAMAAGANEYIMKPFTEDIVREKLEGVGVL